MSGRNRVLKPLQASQNVSAEGEEKTSFCCYLPYRLDLDICIESQEDKRGGVDNGAVVRGVLDVFNEQWTSDN